MGKDCSFYSQSKGWECRIWHGVRKGRTNGTSVTNKSLLLRPNKPNGRSCVSKKVALPLSGEQSSRTTRSSEERESSWGG